VLRDKDVKRDKKNWYLLLPVVSFILLFYFFMNQTFTTAYWAFVASHSTFTSVIN